jgi:hypothetical protein
LLVLKQEVAGLPTSEVAGLPTFEVLALLVLA